MFNRQSAFTFILVFAAGFLAYLAVRDYPKIRETRKQLEDLEGKIEALKHEEERQNDLVEYLNSESYLEKQARLRLNLKKEGEEVVFIYRKDEAKEEGSPEKPNENPFLSKVKEWVKVLRFSILNLRD